MFKISVDNQSYEVKENESVLDTLERNSVTDLFIGCRRGGCGKCRIKVLSGEYIAIRKMNREHISSEDESHNIVLACCIRAVSDLKIEIL